MGQFQFSASDCDFGSHLFDGKVAAFNGGQSPVQVGGVCGGSSSLTFGGAKLHQGAFIMLHNRNVKSKQKAVLVFPSFI